MNLPIGTPLEIIAYRDFHDVPRLILASENNNRFWILDSPFDDDADEYSNFYSVFFIGDELSSSRRAFDSWPDPLMIGESINKISVSSLNFDKTIRREFVLD